MIDKIKSILLEGSNNKDFPGASFCLLVDGVITCDTVGVKDYESNELVTKDTIYDIASLSKVISTTTIIFKLIEENKLSLDTKVSSILKDFRHKDISVYDLLIHSSGLSADITRAAKLRSEEEVYEKIYQAEIIYEKHTKVVYSDIGFILLGMIIEKITNKKINEVADEFIFKPLHMESTSYRPIVKKVAPTEYREDDVYTGLLKGLVHDEKSFALKGLSGHAGLFSTAYDISLFMKAFLSNNFVLKKETIDTLFLSRIKYKDENNNELNRALGYQKPFPNSYFGKNYDYDNTIGHTGFTGCHLMMNKNKNYAFVLLSNAVHPKRNMNKIFDYRKEIAKVLNNI